MNQCPDVCFRRLYDDTHPDGYVESDKDFVLNNLQACLWFLQECGADVEPRDQTEETTSTVLRAFEVTIHKGVHT
jgi:hypothetical protein